MATALVVIMLAQANGLKVTAGCWVAFAAIVVLHWTALVIKTFNGK